MDTLSLLRAGQLAGTRRLDLSCGLKEFPEEIFDLADSLEILNLSGNALSSLPDDLHRLHKLRVIFCSNNQFTHVPEVLGLCRQLSMIGFKANQIRNLPAAALNPELRWLILTDNALSALPDELGECTRLQKLMLSGNQLQDLPVSMQACVSLELLRIASNRFDSLPNWLLKLPRLSWLAYAGNPFCDQHEAAALQRQTKHSIDWDSLSLQHQLGEGASGEIYQAKWRHRGEERNVAAKLFKGELTSDGLPHSEMAACISAGTHANLIGAHGEIVGHPMQRKGLLMSLVDASYRNLAGPPSLESCTRDIYQAGTQLSLTAVLAIAQGIAGAAAHLHAQGILHGDLYAHNILHNEAEHCLLGDFGAASFYRPHEGGTALALEQIEVRAFGCLLEELLDHCVDTERLPSKVPALRSLQERCLQTENAMRPRFNEIQNNLQSIVCGL